MKNNKWIQITIRCTGQVRGLITSMCFDLGSSGSAESGSNIIFYFSHSEFDRDTEETITAYISQLRGLGHDVGELTAEPVRQEDWSRNWRSFFKPVKVSDAVIVKPPWETWAGPEPVVIDIYPRMAFGTGTHETTRLCIQLLETCITPGARIFDVGCGSGIVSIAGVLMGASSAAGIDIDDAAIVNSRENAALNSVEHKTSFIKQDIVTAEPRTFDIIVINMITSLLAKALPVLSGFCRPRAPVIISGVAFRQQDQFRLLCADNSLEILDTKQEHDWLGVLARFTG